MGPLKQEDQKYQHEIYKTTSRHCSLDFDFASLVGKLGCSLNDINMFTSLTPIMYPSVTMIIYARYH